MDDASTATTRRYVNSLFALTSTTTLTVGVMETMRYGSGPNFGEGRNMSTSPATKPHPIQAPETEPGPGQGRFAGQRHERQADARGEEAATRGPRERKEQEARQITLRRGKKRQPYIDPACEIYCEAGTHKLTKQQGADM